MQKTTEILLREIRGNFLGEVYLILSRSKSIGATIDIYATRMIDTIHKSKPIDHIFLDETSNGKFVQRYCKHNPIGKIEISYIHEPGDLVISLLERRGDFKRSAYVSLTADLDEIIALERKLEEEDFYTEMHIKKFFSLADK